ncbi:MAG: class I SAM-dependent methyltransferase [Scytonema hyalinum WJT4-NPBG1]|jgi:predicted O-methyltransferase YrrM|nr:class I SAM-dependent methyltransferase [Scytonema hyalinum WJT4-NPBG1]
MTVLDEKEVLFSTKDLSQLFQVEQEDIIKVLTEKELEQQSINGEVYIKKDEFENLINELWFSLGISYQYYEIPEYLKNCTSPWAVTLVKMYQDKFTYPDSISPEQGDYLRALVCNVAPKNILEIGCFTGVSTIWLAAGLEQIGSQGTVHSVDLFNDIIPLLPHHRGYLTNPLEYAQKSVDAAQLSHKVKFYKKNSKEVGGKIHEFLSEPIDFLFIDGDHTVEGCFNDFMLFYPHVSVGGYIVLHDINPKYCGWYGPRYIIDKFIKKSPHFDLLEIRTNPVNYGMAVIRKLAEDRTLFLRGQLTKVGIWQRIKDKPLGNFLRKRF